MYFNQNSRRYLKELDSLLLITKLKWNSRRDQRNSTKNSKGESLLTWMNYI